MDNYNRLEIKTLHKYSTEVQNDLQNSLFVFFTHDPTKIVFDKNTEKLNENAIIVTSIELIIINT